MRTLRSHLVTAALLAVALLLAAPAAAGQKKKAEAARPPDGLVLLENGSFWRCRYAWGTELVRLESGELVTVHPDKATTRVGRGKDRKLLLRKHPTPHIWGVPTPWPPYMGETNKTISITYHNTTIILAANLWGVIM